MCVCRVCCRGPADSTKRAFDLVTLLIKDPSKDVEQLIPRAKKTPPPSSGGSSRTASNVWSNTTATAAASAATSATSAQNTQKATGGATTSTRNARQTGASTVATTTTTSRASITSVTRPTMSHVTAQVANGTAIWGNPGQLPRPNPTLGMFANVVSKDRSPGAGVSRQLFPGDEKEARLKAMTSAHAAAAAAYSAPTMARTSLVDTTTPTPSARENDLSHITQQPRPQMAPISRPITNHMMGGQQVRADMTLANSTGASAVSLPASSVPQTRNFSPFSNNVFSRITDNILNTSSRKDDEVRMDFAGAARVGVTSAASSISNSVNCFAETLSASIAAKKEDPSRAPGYKAPGNRTNSPKVESETAAPRVPDLSSHMINDRVLEMERFAAAAQGPSEGLMRSSAGFPYSNDVLMARMQEANSASPRGMPTFLNDAYRYMQFHNSPRQSMSSEQLRPHMRSKAPTAYREEEHSYPNTPMTLPTIESKLNPNAPHFIARHPGQGGPLPPHGGVSSPMQHQHQQPPPGQQMHPAFRPSYQATSFTAHNDINANELQNLMNRGGFKPFSPDKGDLTFKHLVIIYTRTLRCAGISVCFRCGVSIEHVVSRLGGDQQCCYSRSEAATHRHGTRPTATRVVWRSRK